MTPRRVWSSAFALVAAIAAFPTSAIAQDEPPPIRWPWPLDVLPKAATVPTRTIHYQIHDRGVAAFPDPDQELGAKLYEANVHVGPILEYRTFVGDTIVVVSLGEDQVSTQQLYKRRDPGALEFGYVYTLEAMRNEYVYQSVDFVEILFSPRPGPDAWVRGNPGSAIPVPPGARQVERIRAQLTLGSDPYEQQSTVEWGIGAARTRSIALQGLLGAGALVTLLSMLLDTLPLVGTVKGIGDAFRGRDAITGEDLAWWQRALGLIPIGGPLLRQAARRARLFDRLADAARAGDDALAAGLRRADDAVGAGARRADDALEAGARRADDLDGAARRADDVGTGARTGTDVAGQPRTGCFAAGTPVLLADGSLRPIETLRPGDEVLAAAGANGRPRIDGLTPRRVLRALQHRSNGRMVRIRVGGENGETTVLATPRHPFATATRYLPAEELEAGDRLLTAGGTEAVVRGVVAEPGSVPVYNLEIEGDHVFFVGDCRLLVHNICEKRSQQDLEAILGDDPDFTFHGQRSDGSFTSEPGSLNGTDLPFGHKASDFEKAKALGIDVDGWYAKDWKGLPPAEAKLRAEAFRAQAKERLRDRLEGFKSYPDVRGVEIRNGEPVKVAYEIKTPRREHENLYEYLRRTARDPDNRLLTQSAQRRAAMQDDDIVHDLVIDLRNFKEHAQNPDFAVTEELYAIQKNLPEYRGMGGYKGVRFITNGPDGQPVLTKLYEIPEWP